MKTLRILMGICVFVLVVGAVIGISGDYLKLVLLPLLALFQVQVIDWSYGAKKEDARPASDTVVGAAQSS